MEPLRSRRGWPIITFCSNLVELHESTAEQGYRDILDRKSAALKKSRQNWIPAPRLYLGVQPDCNCTCWRCSGIVLVGVGLSSLLFYELHYYSWGSCVFPPVPEVHESFWPISGSTITTTTVHTVSPDHNFCLRLQTSKGGGVKVQWESPLRLNYRSRHILYCSPIWTYSAYLRGLG